MTTRTHEDRQVQFKVRNVVLCNYLKGFKEETLNMNDSVPGKQIFEQDEKTMNRSTMKSFEQVEETIKTMECFEQNEEIMNTIEVVNCEPCQEDGKSLPVVGFCVDCQNYLCDSCYSCHCVPKPMKSHKLLNVEEMPRRKVSADLSEICKKHEGEPIKYYCKKHDTVGCNPCMLLEHKPCELYTLSEKAKDVETSAPFIEVCDNLRHIEVESENELALANKNSEASRDFYNKALEKIEDLRKALNAHLDTLKVHVEKEAAVRKDKDTTNMEHLMAKIKSVQAEQTKIKEDLQILQETGQKKQLFIALMKSKRKVENMQKDLSGISRSNYVKRYVFQEGRDISSILENICIVGGLVDVDERIEDGSIRSLKRPCLSEYAEFGIVKRAVLSENCYVSIHSIEKQINVFENNSVSATLHLQSSPWDVCSIDIHRFAVTVPLERKIKRFTFKRHDLFEDGEIVLDSQCEGIDYGDNMLFVASTDPVQVLILTLKGSPLTVIRNEYFGTELFRKPAYIHYSPTSRSINLTDRATEEVLVIFLDENLNLVNQANKRRNKLFKSVYKRNESKIHLWTVQSVYSVAAFKIF